MNELLRLHFNTLLVILALTRALPLYHANLRLKTFELTSTAVILATTPQHSISLREQFEKTLIDG